MKKTNNKKNRNSYSNKDNIQMTACGRLYVALPHVKHATSVWRQKSFKLEQINGSIILLLLQLVTYYYYIHILNLPTQIFLEEYKELQGFLMIFLNIKLYYCLSSYYFFYNCIMSLKLFLRVI